MVFSSLEFLFLFLPATLLVYFVAPLKLRNLALFLVSLVFYGWGGIEYLPLMLAVIFIDYLAGFLIEIFSEQRKKQKAVLIIAIIINLGLLGFFKYADFLIENLALIPALSALRPLGVTLPIGISFYTFQALSYVIDVYRRDVAAQKNPLTFGTYVALFPQLIAGPIVKYRDVEAQLLASRRFSFAMAASGVRTFTVGLAKKVLIANTAGALWETVRDMPANNRTAVAAWFGILLYTAHIYFDFSGYSDMAIGLGKIFGFRFLENFNYPYIAKSITDFWRRWHISLSSWFREYVYIPLGGNRCSKGRMYLNLLTVWLLTGLWHGASWNFVLWGLYYFLLLFIEKAFLGKLLQKLPAFFGHAYALIFIVFGWLIFAFDGATPALGTSAALTYLSNMFGVGGAGFANGADTYEILRNIFFIAAAIIACTPLPRKLFYKFYEKSRAADYLSAVICICGFALCVIYLVNSAYNPFLYFRF